MVDISASASALFPDVSSLLAGAAPMAPEGYEEDPFIGLGR